MSENCPVCGNPVNPGDALCPSCGFKLLGSTQRFAPVTLGDEAIAAPVKGPGRAALRVVRGPQTGTTFALDDDLLSIGRSPQCGVFLNDMTPCRASTPPSCAPRRDASSPTSIPSTACG